MDQKLRVGGMGVSWLDMLQCYIKKYGEETVLLECAQEAYTAHKLWLNPQLILLVGAVMRGAQRQRQLQYIVHSHIKLQAIGCWEDEYKTQDARSKDGRDFSAPCLPENKVPPSCSKT